MVIINRYGKKCRFAHGDQELRTVQRHVRYKTEICRTYHMTGTCLYGVRCTFIHDESARLTDDDGSTSSSSSSTLTTPACTLTTNNNNAVTTPTFTAAVVTPTTPIITNSNNNNATLTTTAPSPTPVATTTTDQHYYYPTRLKSTVSTPELLLNSIMDNQKKDKRLAAFSSITQHRHDNVESFSNHHNINTNNNSNNNDSNNNNNSNWIIWQQHYRHPHTDLSSHYTAPNLAW